ncbi:MAG: M28 family metallopeptidase [Flavobacteriaceae bacterium]|nr:M28 family metallopeptidase [Flavobacteriaceae bacterium]
MIFFRVFIFSILILFPAVTLGQEVSPAVKYAQSITQQELKELLYVYASDYFKGRDTGTKGQRLAADFIRSFYRDRAIEPAEGTEDYYQPVTLFTRRGDTLVSENVVSVIKGDEIPDEYIVVTAHLDHIGVNEKGEIYNGADDDGSGTVAILEIAEAFQQAVKNGDGPKRSIIFLHVTGEEKGLLGSGYYTDKEPLYPLEDTIANLNMDMIGRSDPKRENPDPNYIYLIGSDILSQDLHDISEAVNKEFVSLELDYTYADINDPNRFYYRSDHFHFAKNNIPVIFYFNGTHEDYHQVTDTVDKILYDVLQRRTQLIFHTLWELANREDRIRLKESVE